MGNDLKIVLKYIKSYKSRSIAIILSIVLGTALIVGVGTLSRGAQQADLDRLKRETGTHHVYFRDINKEQLKIVKNGNDIKDVYITSYYASTEKGEKLPINILHASENYLTNNSNLIKGRFPKADNEVVLEEWILNSMGLEPNINQEITFKLYQKEKPETFKVVGVLKDRYREKSVGVCEMFLALDEDKLNKFTPYVEFNEGSEISKNIADIAKKAKLNIEEQIRPNSMLIASVGNNGALDITSRNTAIAISLFAGLVVYSIYTISVYQRIREYGMLRAVGSTNLRVFKLILSELLILSLTAMPIGILIGMGGAQIFNKIVGNIQFEGTVRVTPFVIPLKIILLSITCTIFVIFIISILTYMKIRKVSPIEAIRRNLGEDKKIKKSNFIVSKLSKNIPISKSISMKNIFRNKKGFIMIMLSMSIGGIMVIKSNYAYSRSDAMAEDQNRGMYRNGDFVLSVNTAGDEENGLNDEQINEISNVDGINEVKAARIIHSRMPLGKKDILDMQFFDESTKGGYFGKVLNGLLMKDKENDGYLLKQKLKGFNDEMLKSLNDYLISGKIDIEKMKKENLAVIYMPHTYKDSYGTRDTVVGGGEPIVDIKVGDTVKVKIPKGKIDGEKYWKGQDNYEYKEHEFKVGAIVNYPFADENQYSADMGVDVITSADYLEKIEGKNNYDIVYANMDKGADHKAINKKLGKIGSKVPGVTTVDMTQEKETSEKMLQKMKIYDYGVIVILFVISIFNIINNVSYNLTSRTSEFGMLRAVGISEKDFKNMIIFEGLLYGIISSIIVIVLGVLLQLRMYKTFGFESYGMEFKLAYGAYILVTITNIVVGLIATYLPSRKIKQSNIVEAINIIE
ncbi:ABC transporter permease [[Clostridium] dakarense]|uniref:ABC transporter permease n=1 Tax=Faecalimicrobium dakarense TaxID=1301100 RepID=UPI0004B222B8|nr:ABC transporter permease [[Clostridium] dakarense]